MICPVCRHEIPAKFLACDVCARRKSRAAYLEHQSYFLPLILEGKLALSLGKPDNSTLRQRPHIQLVGERQQTFCGMPLHTRERRGVYYADIASTPDLCPDCKSTLVSLVEKFAIAEGA